MTAAWTIRPARPDEAPAVHALHARTVRAVNAADYTGRQVERWLARQDVDRIRRRIADGEMLIAVDDADAVLGFASHHGDELLGLYVDPAHLRRGVGTALLAGVEARLGAAGHARARSVTTVAARDFYAARGWVEVRQLTWPPTDPWGMEAWELVKDLGGDG